MMPMMHSVYSI